MKRKHSAKFVDCTTERLLECHLFIVKITTTRSGLIEAYKAARNSLGPGAELDKVIAACREKQAAILIESEK